MQQSFEVQGYQVTVFDPQVKDCPIIYTNTINGENDVLWITCQNAKMPPFVLVSITNLNWDTDMAPWYCPPCGPTDTPCYGGADAYLKILVDQIIPAAESRLEFKPAERIIAGYSLAGLFAVYSMYQTDVFDKVVSGSGSFWFPEFTEYVQKHEMKRKPQKMYFSLGRQESHTKYEIFNSVQTNTEWLVKYYADKGIDDIFVLENGNHYTDPWGRMQRGMDWILK